MLHTFENIHLEDRSTPPTPGPVLENHKFEQQASDSAPSYSTSKYISLT